MTQTMPLFVLTMLPSVSASTADGTSDLLDLSRMRPLIDVAALALLLLAGVVIVALVRRSRRVDSALAACATARTELESFERAALPAPTDPQGNERELNRRGEVGKARTDAAIRAVPKAGPSRPEWQEAYSLGMQLAAAGRVEASRELLRAAVPHRLLPGFVYRAIPQAAIELLWRKAGRISRGCESLESAAVWARIARESAAAGKFQLRDEASDEASRLFRESLRWLPEEDDIPVHLRWAELLREQQKFAEAISELDKAEPKARKRLPSVLAPVGAASGYPSPTPPSAPVPPASTVANDLLAELVTSRALLRMQQLGVPVLSPDPAAARLPGPVDAEAAKGIERDLAELKRLESSVSDRRLASVRHAALVVRYEHFRGDTSRANAAAADIANVRAPNSGAIDGPASQQPRLSPASQTSLAAELRWDRQDQLLLASLRLIALRRLRDEVPAIADGFAGRRALEDFVEAVTFTWLHYDQRRALELPMVSASLVALSGELDQKVRAFRSGDLWELHGWLDYVRARSQIRQPAPAPQPPVVLPVPPLGPIVGSAPSPEAAPRAAMASLICRVSNPGFGFGQQGGRIEVLADHGVVSEDWTQASNEGVDLVVTDGSGRPLRKVGLFGFPTAHLKYPVSLSDPVELSGGLFGKVSRIATVDLSGLSDIPPVIRFSVRSRYGARVYGTADFPSSAFSIAPPPTRRVSVDDARQVVFILSSLWACLLRLSGRSAADNIAVMALRDILHGELGDEGVRELGVSVREGSQPAVLDVDFVQSLVSYLERQNPREDGLRDMAMAAWQQVARRPDLRAALEQLLRRVPSTVLSDAAMHAIGLPRPSAPGARSSVVEPAPFRHVHTTYPAEPAQPKFHAFASAAPFAVGALPERFFAEVGVFNPLQQRADFDRGLQALNERRLQGGLDPIRAERIRALIAELEAHLGSA